ncbi:hypothetical protein HYPSUDRAFT_199037 [Hypholoma sublateritium FD-334 SS-4]|uniref:Uncharacterized protein n=1 Tax=Hypholoma sublateritium (strain FD-334 SS-4) TaxID=945553 RepID=A0A0D2Q3U8_HYPSF|nr:hypothetical protein HYPSUDRAFT_199037 [Hypholoma sublateritium FD-334 SS-4]
MAPWTWYGMRSGRPSSKLASLSQVASLVEEARAKQNQHTELQKSFVSPETRARLRKEYKAAVANLNIVKSIMANDSQYNNVAGSPASPQFLTQTPTTPIDSFVVIKAIFKFSLADSPPSDARIHPCTRTGGPRVAAAATLAVPRNRVSDNATLHLHLPSKRLHLAMAASAVRQPHRTIAATNSIPQNAECTDPHPRHLQRQTTAPLPLGYPAVPSMMMSPRWTTASRATHEAPPYTARPARSPANGDEREYPSIARSMPSRSPYTNDDPRERDYPSQRTKRISSRSAQLSYATTSRSTVARAPAHALRIARLSTSYE